MSTHCNTQFTSKNEAKLIVSGYIRKLQKILTPLQIPTSINKLILSFYMCLIININFGINTINFNTHLFLKQITKLKQSWTPPNVMEDEEHVFLPQYKLLNKFEYKMPYIFMYKYHSWCTLKFSISFTIFSDKIQLGTKWVSMQINYDIITDYQHQQKQQKKIAIRFQWNPQQIINLEWHSSDERAYEHGFNCYFRIPLLSQDYNNEILECTHPDNTIDLLIDKILHSHIKRKKFDEFLLAINVGVYQ